MKKKLEGLLVILFVGMLFLFALLFLISPHERFSELENRYLQSAPKLTWDNLLSKKFADETETYITDHFPFRAKWLAVKSAAEQARLQPENNGIYKGKDGYLLEKFTKPDELKLQKYIDSINQFSMDHPQVQMTFMLVPTSVGLYPERLPWLAPSYPEEPVNQWIAKKLQNHLDIIDGFEFLEPYKTEPIYYRTDHHWTTYGAYLAYVAYATRRNWEPYRQQDFTIKTVSDSFLGSYHTRGQFNGVKPDSIETYIPVDSNVTEMYIADNDQTTISMYDESFLDKKDQYSYFQGGVHALMKLTTTLNQKQIDVGKLLVIKDSYAHSMLPFLTQHVSEIHVIDPRYYNGSVSDYMETNDISHVLFLFNTSSLVENPPFLR